MKGSNMGKNVEFSPLFETGKGCNWVRFWVWAKDGAKKWGEMLCTSFVCVSENIFTCLCLHNCSIARFTYG